MTQGIYTITENSKIAKCVYRMKLSGDTSAITAPGQFINIKIDGLYLRRPISVCDYTEDSITIIYKVLGVGTEKMACMQEGETLDILVGLGNGYHTAKSGQTPLLIGGGVGVPPLYNLAKVLLSEGKKPTVVLGFNTKEEVFLEEDFLALGVPCAVATVDGSYGTQGFVTTLVKQAKAYSYFYTCGPEVMLKSVAEQTKASGELSFEERMGCGFGACMGCSCETKYGNKRICKDGPVLEKEEIIW